MNLQILFGSFIPLVGTTIGSLAVYFLKNNSNEKLEINLSLLAAGVMLAASIWGLIIPSINLSEHLNKWSFVPTVIGIWLGIIFFIVMEKLISKKDRIMPLAVVIHNIPEGMAVGVGLASSLLDNSLIASAFALSIGIAIQNIPEGAIISMPMYSKQKNKNICFLNGFLSGVVEPIFAILTVFTVGLISSVMPYIMSFAAGCMIYVCIKELIPRIKSDEGMASLISFILGFSIMLALDVALG